MASTDFFITGDHTSAREALSSVLKAEGFEFSLSPTNGWNLSRGSATATALLGAFAGKKKQHLVFSMDFFEHETQLVARLTRDTGGGAMAGAIGVSRSAEAFSQLDQAIGTELTRLGILGNVIHHP